MNRKNWLQLGALLLASQGHTGVIGCPNHEAQAPQWRHDPAGQSNLAGRTMADPETKMLETAHFAIFYQTTGPHAVARANVDLDGNGTPDAIDTIGQIAERVWRLGIDTLGYLPPKGHDTTVGYRALVPAGKFPIEVADIVTFVPNWGGKMFMGFAVNPSIDKTGANRQSLLIENDFIDTDKNLPIQVKVDPINNHGDSLLIDYSKDPVSGWKVAISHEFYHNLQHRYDASFTYAFHEMTAVWFATRCYPQVKHHWQYLPGYVSHLSMSAFGTDDNWPYENYPFVSTLVDVYGIDILKAMWPLHKSAFNPDEAVWFHNIMDSLQKDEVQFNLAYVRNALELMSGAPGLLNEQGNVQVSPVIWPGYILRGTSTFFGSQSYGIWVHSLKMAHFVDGWNVAFQMTYAQSTSVGGYVSLPTKKIEVFHPNPSHPKYTVTKGPSDTIWWVGVMTVIYPDASGSIDAAGTQDPPEGVLTKGSGAKLAPQYRMNLSGRPASAQTRGMVLEGSPATGWIRKVKMGE